MTGAAATGELLEADGRYFGTTVAGSWLDRVVAHGPAARSRARLLLSAAGLDVHRGGDGFLLDSGLRLGNSSLHPVWAERVDTVVKERA